MSNNKVPWKDSILTEPIKYAPKLLHKKIALSLNKALETEEEIDTGTGILVPTQKPWKKGPPKNIRPIKIELSPSKKICFICIQ